MLNLKTLNRGLSNMGRFLAGRNPASGSTKSPRFLTQNITKFNAEEYVKYFDRNYSKSRPLPALTEGENWPTLSKEQQAALKDFLMSIYQGETSEGKMGEKLVKLSQDEADRQSLQGYVRDEERHGEEFLWLAEQLGLGFDPTKPHEGGRQTQVVAAMLNWNFGRLVDIANLLLVAEVIIVPVYMQLAKKTGHPLVEAVISNIIRDEAGHIRYHGDRVKDELVKAGFFSRLVLKLVHQFGLGLLLFSINIIIWKPVRVLIGMSWVEMLELMESTYNKFYKEEMSIFRTHFLFHIARWLPNK